MFTDKQDILAAFVQLGRRLAMRDAAPVTLVVCGAAALNCTDLLTRQTRDVDVLGMLAQRGKASLLGKGLPEEVLAPVADVAKDLGLEIDWLNDRSLILQSKPGLPAGFAARVLHPPLGFGPCLCVTFPSRQDMVALKFYAALDGRLEEAMRHFRDLFELAPTRVEVEFAASWLLDRPTSEVFRHKIRDLADRLGFADLDGFNARDELEKRTRVEPGSPGTPHGQNRRRKTRKDKQGR